MPAVELALRQGADGVEIDVQLSSDGQVVVVHDETVDRTTDGAGAVRALSWATLRSLDASTGLNGFAGTPIPTLTEVLDLARHAVVNIELKNGETPSPGLEERVVAAVASCRAEDRVVYSSFRQASLQQLRSLGVSAPVGLLYSHPRWRPGRDAQRVGATAVHPPLQTVGGWLVRRIHRRGLPIHVWTVNAAADVRRMARLGVDAIITDFPAAARAALVSSE